MYKPIDPQKTSTNSRQINKGNQTTIYHNQIAKTELKIDITKQPDLKKTHTHFIQRNKTLQSLWRSECRGWGDEQDQSTVAQRGPHARDSKEPDLHGGWPFQL